MHATQVFRTVTMKVTMLCALAQCTVVVVVIDDMHSDSDSDSDRIREAAINNNTHNDNNTLMIKSRIAYLRKNAEVSPGDWFVESQ